MDIEDVLLKFIYNKVLNGHEVNIAYYFKS